jgi:hypothetical protein
LDNSILNHYNLYNQLGFFVIMEEDVKIPKLVLVESPFRGKDYNETRDNIFYARLCVRDSILREEAPYASHLFYTQTGLLDDKIESERMQGINAGLAWGSNAEVSAFYTDRGISRGMEYGKAAAKKAGRKIEERTLGSPEKVASMIEEMANEKPAIETGILF